MKTARIYSLLVPISERYDDMGEPPLASIPVERVTGKKWEAAVLGRPHTIQTVRITIPEIENEKIDDEEFKVALKLRQFVLDCIRIVYDPNAEYFRKGESVFAMWNFLEPNEPPNFSVVVKEPLNLDYRVNSAGLLHMMAALPAIRPLIHLLADGADARLPMQFRFLSWYKIIELHYVVADIVKFRTFAAPFVPDFFEIYSDVSNVATMCRQLKRLRNRCAHIKLEDGDLGFSHPQADALDLHRAHKIIHRMAIRAITTNYPESPLRFAETPEQAAIQFAEMQAAGLKPVKVAG